MIGAVRSGTGSLLALDAADLEVACLKKAARGDGLIVRLWNPTGAAQEGKLTLGLPFASVVTTNLNEDPQADAAIKLRPGGRRTVRLTVGARKIITLLFRFPKGKSGTNNKDAL
jgi:alpha-mannosidase